MQSAPPPRTPLGNQRTSVGPCCQVSPASSRAHTPARSSDRPEGQFYLAVSFITEELSVRMTSASLGNLAARGPGLEGGAAAKDFCVCPKGSGIKSQRRRGPSTWQAEDTGVFVECTERTAVPSDKNRWVLKQHSLLLL